MKKKFDYEYATQYVKEMKYLDAIGIKYNFVCFEFHIGKVKI